MDAARSLNSRALCAGAGAGNTSRHAPMLLAANGLDICIGTPDNRSIQGSFVLDGITSPGTALCAARAQYSRTAGDRQADGYTSASAQITTLKDRSSMPGRFRSSGQGSVIRLLAVATVWKPEAVTPPATNSHAASRMEVSSALSSATPASSEDWSRSAATLFQCSTVPTPRRSV